MLHLEAVDAPTLGLLKKLMNVPFFQPLRLVGGTSLALQYGHRKSIDLDLFGSFIPDEIEIGAAITELGVSYNWLNKSKNINSLLIDGIKTDIVNYTYPWIGNLLQIDALRLADTKDIAAMKLAAITGRGTKKDFTDLYFLLKHYSLGDMMEMYTQKYADGSVFMVLKSLTYFEDAESDEMPEMLVPVKWEEIRKVITENHNQYVKSL